MNKNLLPVAKEGIVYVAFCTIAVLALTVLDFEFLAFIGTIITIAFIYLFRNPVRSLPEFSANSVLCVSDGVVKSIEEINECEYTYKIEIDSNFLDVGVLRTPFNASLVKVVHKNGTKLSKNSELFLDLNEMAELVFEDSNKNRIKVVHRVKQSFAPLYLDAIELQNLRQTSRYGMMINGVTTLYFPSNFRVNVNVGNELKASESLMGYFS